MFPAWTWIVGFWLGATIGSFLNVVIYRLPRGLSLAEPKNSFCPNCKHALAAPDLIPLLSWAISRGKCRYCKVAVPSRYFFVELLTGALWAGIWWKYFVAMGPNADWIRGCIYMATAATLVAIIYIDWELYIIPDQVNAFLLFLGAVLAALKGDWAFFFWGWFVGWGILWGIAVLGRLLFGKDAMGHGDIKMMRGVGAIIGVQLLLANMAVAIVAGLVIGVFQIIVASVRAKNSAPEPEQATEEEILAPEPIKDLFVLGGTYLLALDIPAIWFPQLYERMGYKMEPESIEDDGWKPSFTTIPFGPYLAIGAIVCMLFSDGIQNVWQNYWRKVTEPSAVSISISEAPGTILGNYEVRSNDLAKQNWEFRLVNPVLGNSLKGARVERVGRRIGKEI